MPQLQRAGITLDWATADMPDVSGVTPGNALVVLRILQEAITNAIKHGPATTITVRAAPTPDGQVAISVANDGRAFAPGSGGFGLANMRRRARQLNGGLEIKSHDRGVVLTLRLPSRLPDFEVDPQAGDAMARTIASLNGNPPYALAGG
jgi:signal transduction histidine kinase